MWKHFLAIFISDIEAIIAECLPPFMLLTRPMAKDMGLSSQSQCLGRHFLLSWTPLGNWDNNKNPSHCSSLTWVILSFYQVSMKWTWFMSCIILYIESLDTLPIFNNSCGLSFFCKMHIFKQKQVTLDSIKSVLQCMATLACVMDEQCSQCSMTMAPGTRLWLVSGKKWQLQSKHFMLSIVTILAVGGGNTRTPMDVRISAVATFRTVSR